MKVKKIIINRLTDWYSVVDINTDPFYMAIIILGKLSSNLSRGVLYNRISISNKLINQINNDAVNVVDKAISILVARNLITIETTKDLKKHLFITELGSRVLQQYEEEFENVDR